MLILFKHGPKKYAYDTVSGTLLPLTALAKRMLEATEVPMPPVCPTALRYELAKYDSADVEETYDELYRRAAGGAILAPDNGTLKTPDTDGDTARSALLAASERLNAPVTVTGPHTALAIEILSPKGLLKI